MAETEHIPIKAGNGGRAAEIANSLQRFIEAVSEKPAEPKPRRKIEHKVEKLNPQLVVGKQAEIVKKILEKIPRETLTQLSSNDMLVQLAQSAVEDEPLVKAGHAEAVKKKLLDLRRILTSTPPSRQIEELSSFFNQADNWTPEAAPYMTIARETVMAHLMKVPQPEQYNVLTAEELVVHANAELSDYTDAVDFEAYEREHPTVTSIIGDEDIASDYSPKAEFEQLVRSGHGSAGMETFVHDWNDRLQLLKEHGFGEIFSEQRLQNDLKDIENLVRQGKVTNEDAMPWRNTINKYLRTREISNQRMRAGSRSEGHSISPEDIERSQPGHWKNISRPRHPYEFSYYLKREDIDILMRPNGEEIWLNNYFLKKTANPRGEAQPTFVEGIQVEEVENFTKWKYGGQDGLDRMLLMRRKRFGVEHAHQLNKLFTQEGLSPEKMLEIYMQLTPDDLNFLHEFKEFNKAIGPYEIAIHTLLSERRVRWFQLRDGNAKLGILKKEVREARIKNLERKLGLTPEAIEAKKEELNVLNNQPGGVKTKEDTQRARLLRAEIQFGTNEKMGELRSDEQLELARRIEERTELNYGVALWADDWDFNPHKFNNVKEKWKRITELQNKGSLSQADQIELKELTASQVEYDSLLKITHRTPEQQKRLDVLKKRLAEEQDILNNFGLSPIEIKVKKQMLLQKEMALRKQLARDWSGTDERLTAYVKAELEKEDLVTNIKLAILMARYDFVYTRHVVSIAGTYRIVGDVEEVGVKSVMRAPVLEDLERVYAWQTFFKRFFMGGEAGRTAMAIFNRETQYHKTEDGSLLKLSQSKMWDRLIESAEMHPEQRATLDAIETWEKKSGISFAQVLNNQILKGGGVYDASVWRAEIGVTDEMRTTLISFVEDLRANSSKLGANAVPDNAGIGFQFAATDRTTDAGIMKRLYLLEKTRKRDPVILMEFMAGERYDLLAKQFTSDSGEPLVDFDILSQALSLANNDITLNKNLLVSPDIDLGGDRDFTEHVAPYINQLLTERGMSGDIGKYQTFIQKMMEIAKEKALVWAKTDFPLTLRIGDLDWAETDYHKAGTLSMTRRGRDNMGMFKAAAILRELMSNHELLFHPDPNKVIDKLLEMEKEMIGYTGNKDAAAAFTDALATYIRMNEFRTRRTLGWAPGGIIEWGLRQLTDVREEYIEKGVNLIPKPLFRLLGVKPDQIEKVRKGIMKKLNGNLVSYAVEYGSAHGNAFDEKAISTIIATAQDRGGFIGMKHLAHDLMREFKVTLPYRVLASVRRVYWVAFVAILAAAVASAMKEEEKHR